MGIGHVERLKYYLTTINSNPLDIIPTLCKRKILTLLGPGGISNITELMGDHLGPTLESSLDTLCLLDRNELDNEEKWEHHKLRHV